MRKQLKANLATTATSFTVTYQYPGFKYFDQFTVLRRYEYKFLDKILNFRLAIPCIRLQTEELCMDFDRDISFRRDFRTFRVVIGTSRT
jgi:hypothetical protein